VREHDAIRERHELHEREETAARDRLGARFAGRRERLVVAVERGLVVAHENLLGDEALEQLGGVRVLRVALAFRQDQPNDVVRIARGELRALLGVDDVVRGRDDAREPAGDLVGVVAKGRERSDLGHVSAITTRQPPSAR
jgi:hypothetical protein